MNRSTSPGAGGRLAGAAAPAAPAAMRPISLLICALGGEGGGVLTEWLVETARHAGHPAQSTSIPGVAQRTGSTTYYVEVWPQPGDMLGGRRPVFSLNPVPGALDALVSSELLETARQIGNGMTSPERTCIISSTSRTLTTHERMQMGDGRADTDRMLRLVREFGHAHHLFDMGAIARECGTVVSAVMLGAVAGSGLFPFPRESYEAVVRAGGKGAEASLRGFGRAFDQVRQARRQTETIAAMLDGDGPAPAAAAAVASPAPGADPATTAPPLPEAVAARFPAEVHDLLRLGYARLVDYHDRAYADRYVARLARVLDAERAAGADADRPLPAFATTGEMARWLALWMAFDDIVRVADLKSRASRQQRVRREVKAADGDLLRVYDHFKPGVPEFAALLPPALAARLTAWEGRRVAAGRAPWALPLKIGTHSVSGMLALRTLARLKGRRERGSRFALEQRLIDTWLDGVVAGLRRQHALGHEIARCGRLIKGYGSTNERGKANLLHIVEHLAGGADATAAAGAIAATRDAALADEAGKALDATLAQHGAPPRPVREQPIRWIGRSPGRTAP